MLKFIHCDWFIPAMLLRTGACLLTTRCDRWRGGGGRRPRPGALFGRARENGSARAQAAATGVTSVRCDAGHGGVRPGRIGHGWELLGVGVGVEVVQRFISAIERGHASMIFKELTGYVWSLEFRQPLNPFYNVVHHIQSRRLTQVNNALKQKDAYFAKAPSLNMFWQM